LLDHIILGCRNLEEGVSFVEKQTGVRAAFGGRHIGRGTHNALLSLGDCRYLEILAPDPMQESLSWFGELTRISKPEIVTWAASVRDLPAFVTRLRSAGIFCTDPAAGSRTRPDGRILRWNTVDLEDDWAGRLPFFIDWSADSIHPSLDSPSGCSLKHFLLAGPDPGNLTQTFATLELDTPIEFGPILHLRAEIAGPRGVLTITS